MARGSPAWARRLTLAVLAVLGASIGGHLTLWAISLRAPIGDQAVRIPARFYVGHLNAAILWGFPAVWALLFAWGAFLMLLDKPEPTPDCR